MDYARDGRTLIGALLGLAAGAFVGAIVGRLYAESAHPLLVALDPTYLVALMRDFGIVGAIAGGCGGGAIGHGWRPQQPR